MKNFTKSVSYITTTCIILDDTHMMWLSCTQTQNSGKNSCESLSLLNFHACRVKDGGGSSGEAYDGRYSRPFPSLICMRKNEVFRHTIVDVLKRATKSTPSSSLYADKACAHGTGGWCP